MAASPGGDLVPVRDRVRYLALFRVAATAVALVVLLLSDLPEPGPTLAAIGVGYVLLVSAATISAANRGRRPLGMFAAGLLGDGVVLVAAVYATGWLAGPLAALPVIHLIVVVLLASPRTGIKLATWYSLLTLLVDEAQATSLLPAIERPTPWVYIVAAWVITIVTASASAVNERELRRRRVDLDALATFAQALDTTSEPVEVSRIVAEGVRDTFDLARVAVVLLQSGSLHVAAVAGGNSDGEPIAVSEVETISRALEGRGSVLVSRPDPVDDAWLLARLPDATNLAVVPLLAEGRGLGVLVTEHHMRPGSRLEHRVLEMLERFAAHAGLAIANADLAETMRQHAQTDGLTGLPNRRAFDLALRRELERSRRSAAPLSLAMIDLDHFKTLNDTHGHLAGDDVLRAIGEVLRASTRVYDLPARYGGEEFAVIFPDTGTEGAREAAEHLRRVIAAANTIVPVTATVGVATAKDHVDPSQLIEAADSALYEGKRGGRDRVVQHRIDVSGAIASDPTG